VGPLVIVVLVGLTAVFALRSIRGTLTDRHSLEEHHRALDTLGAAAHQQDGATPLPPDLPGARAHVRIVRTEAAHHTKRSDAAAPPPSRRASSASRARREGHRPRGTDTRPRPGVEHDLQPSLAPAADDAYLTQTAAAAGAAEPSQGAEAAGVAEAAQGADAATAADAASLAAQAAEPARGTDGPEATDWVQAIYRSQEAERPDTYVTPTPEARREPEVLAAPRRDFEPLPSPTPLPPAGSLGQGTVAAPSTTVAHRRRRRHRRTLGRRVAAAATAAAVVAAAVGLAALLTSRHHDHPPAAAIAEPAATLPAPSTTATTAVPAVLVSSDSQGAHYNLASSATVELVPSSPCWVEIRAGGATGQLVFQGLVRPGERRPIPATTPVWLRLGNPPGVAIVVNGTALQPPGRTSSQPYNFTFAPATNG
jgi:hypothetical protein